MLQRSEERAVRHPPEFHRAVDAARGQRQRIRTEHNLSPLASLRERSHGARVKALRIGDGDDGEKRQKENEDAKGHSRQYVSGEERFPSDRGSAR
jgi:hypothetical protein